MLVNLIHVSKRQSNKSGNVLAASGSGYMQMQFHNTSKPRLKSRKMGLLMLDCATHDNKFSDS